MYVVPDENDPKGQTVYLELTPPPEVMYKTSPGSSQQMNVLGIVIFSATMGEHGRINVLLHHASSSESSHLLLDLKVDTSAQSVSHSSTHNPLPSCSGPHEQPYNQYTMTH